MQFKPETVTLYYNDAHIKSAITANNALAVLRYSVGLAGDDSPINKPIAA